MICPLCQQRRARRACPALGHQICPVCCGTKRLVEIQCPPDCAYLATSREHPASVVVRRQQRDLGLAVHITRDLNQRQSQLFVLIAGFLVQYSPPELHQLVDDDVAQAASALSATFETAVRGVIYEHRPTSLPAERLAAALKPMLAEAGKGGGTAFERDAAVVLRRLEEGARGMQAADPAGSRGFLDLLGRLVRPAADRTEPAKQEPPRLIVP